MSTLDAYNPINTPGGAPGLKQVLQTPEGPFKRYGFTLLKLNCIVHYTDE